MTRGTPSRHLDVHGCDNTCRCVAHQQLMHTDTAAWNWPKTPEYIWCYSSKEKAPCCSPERNVTPRHGIAASDVPLDNSETIVPPHQHKRSHH